MRFQLIFKALGTGAAKRKSATVGTVRGARGFSLVEVTIALGVLSVSMVTLFGLLPVGLQVFRDAIDTTEKTQIVQAISNIAEQTEFSNLGGDVNGLNPVGTKLTTELSSASLRSAALPVYYYFNDEGEQIGSSVLPPLSTPPSTVVYTAAVTYWVPQSSGQANLPANTTSTSFAIMWIDIYNNKGILLGGIPAGKSQTFILHIANYGKRI